MLTRGSLITALLALAALSLPAGASAEPAAWYPLALVDAIHVGPRMSPHAADVAVAGEVRCRDIAARRCRGYLDHRPIELVVRRGASVDIEVYRADVDTVMALVGPSGTFVDDDSGRGDLSRLRVVLDPGVHYLYLGTRHRHRVGRARLVIDAGPARVPVVVVPPRRVPPRVVVAPPHRRPPVIVVYDDDDSSDDRRRRRGRRRGHDDDSSDDRSDDRRR